MISNNNSIKSLDLPSFSCKEKTHNSLAYLNIDQSTAIKVDKQIAFLTSIYVKKWDEAKNNLDPSLNMNIKIEKGSNKGLTPFLWAAFHKRWDLLEEIIDKYPDTNRTVSFENGLCKGVTPLWITALHGRRSLFDKIRSGSSIDPNNRPEHISYKGLTFFLLAARYRWWDIVYDLLHNHKQVDITATPLSGSFAGITPLWLAANWNQEKIIRKILENYTKPNVNASPVTGKNANTSVFWWLTYRGHWEIIKEILERKIPINTETAPTAGSEKGLTPIWYAAWKKQWDVVQMLLEQYPNIKLDCSPATGDGQGKTILLIACSYRKRDIVELILQNENPGNINTTPAQGESRGVSPLWLAANWNQEKIIRKMLEHHTKPNINASPVTGTGSNTSAFWLLAYNGRWQIIKDILQQKIPIDTETAPTAGSKKGLTPIWYAAWKKQWDVVQMLLEQYPNIKLDCSHMAGINQGKTVLWYAVKEKQFELVKKILEKDTEIGINTSPTEGNEAGETPLWLAAAYERWDIIKTMLQKETKPDINSYPKNEKKVGTTPLWYAVRHEKWDVVDMMLEKAAEPIDVDSCASDEVDISPLWKACYSGKWNLVKQMLEKCSAANINISPYGNQKTPLQLALTAKRDTIIRLMLEKAHELDIHTAKKYRFKSCSLFDLFSKDWEIVSLLLKQDLKKAKNDSFSKTIFTNKETRDVFFEKTEKLPWKQQFYDQFIQGFKDNPSLLDVIIQDLNNKNFRKKHNRVFYDLLKKNCSSTDFKKLLETSAKFISANGLFEEHVNRKFDKENADTIASAHIEELPESLNTKLLKLKELKVKKKNKKLKYQDLKSEYTTLLTSIKQFLDMRKKRHEQLGANTKLNCLIKEKSCRKHVTANVNIDYLREIEPLWDKIVLGKEVVQGKKTPNRKKYTRPETKKDEPQPVEEELSSSSDESAENDIRNLAVQRIVPKTIKELILQIFTFLKKPVKRKHRVSRWECCSYSQIKKFKSTQRDYSELSDVELENQRRRHYIPDIEKLIADDFFKEYYTEKVRSEVGKSTYLIKAAVELQNGTIKEHDLQLGVSEHETIYHCYLHHDSDPLNRYKASADYDETSTSISELASSNSARLMAEPKSDLEVADDGTLSMLIKQSYTESTFYTLKIYPKKKIDLQGWLKKNSAYS